PYAGKERCSGGLPPLHNLGDGLLYPLPRGRNNLLTGLGLCQEVRQTADECTDDAELREPGSTAHLPQQAGTLTGTGTDAQQRTNALPPTTASTANSRRRLQPLERKRNTGQRGRNSEDRVLVVDQVRDEIAQLLHRKRRRRTGSRQHGEEPAR